MENPQNDSSNKFRKFTDNYFAWKRTLKTFMTIFTFKL